MDAIKQMTEINNITNLIAENLGKLHGYGVITVEDSFEIMKEISEKQYEWMKNNFSFNEINTFVDRYMK